MVNRVKGRSTFSVQEMGGGDHGSVGTQSLHSSPFPPVHRTRGNVQVLPMTLQVHFHIAAAAHEQAICICTCFPACMLKGGMVKELERPKRGNCGGVWKPREAQRGVKEQIQHSTAESLPSLIAGPTQQMPKSRRCLGILHNAAAEYWLILCYH